MGERAYGTAFDPIPDTADLPPAAAVPPAPAVESADMLLAAPDAESADTPLASVDAMCASVRARARAARSPWCAATRTTERCRGNVT